MIRKNLDLLKLMDELAARPGADGGIMLRQFEARQRLIRQDQEVRLVHVIRSGVVKCTLTEDNGKDYILEFLGEGEILGELEAIRRAPALSHVDTLTPLKVYTMTDVEFRHLLGTIPELNAIVMELLATRVFNAATKGARQQLYTLSETLPQLLASLKTQQLQFTKQELAEYLGISVRSLNRLLKDQATRPDIGPRKAR